MFLACLKVAGIITGVIWGLLVVPLYVFGDAAIVWSVIAGCLLSAFCFTAGFYAVCRSLHASLNRLMLAVFGGMLARLLLIGVVFFLVITQTSLHVLGFLFSLLGFYLLYMVIELYFLKNRLVEGD